MGQRNQRTTTTIQWKQNPVLSVKHVTAAEKLPVPEKTMQTAETMDVRLILDWLIFQLNLQWVLHLMNRLQQQKHTSPHQSGQWLLSLCQKPKSENKNNESDFFNTYIHSMASGKNVSKLSWAGPPSFSICPYLQQIKSCLLCDLPKSGIAFHKPSAHLLNTTLQHAFTNLKWNNLAMLGLGALLSSPTGRGVI